MNESGEIDQRLVEEMTRAAERGEGGVQGEFLGRKEEWARRNLLEDFIMYPESPEDIAIAVTEILENYTDVGKAEGQSPYILQNAIKATETCTFVFGHSNLDLEEKKYVDGKIQEDGYLSPDGRPNKAGFVIKVETDRKEETRKQEKQKRHQAREVTTVQTFYIPTYDENNRITGYEPEEKEVTTRYPEYTETWEEVFTTTNLVERFYYGKENERQVLFIASTAAGERLINTARQHDLFSIIESFRADISGLTTSLYLKAKHISNDQFRQVFNSPDISKITPENLDGKEYGTKIDRAMRMMDLLGHAETKEKMEDFMNKPTFDKIIASVKDNALDVMHASGYEDKEAKDAKDEVKVARFLVGKGAVKENGKWVLKGWKNFEERDPSRASQEEWGWFESDDPEENKKWRRGFAAKKYEKEVRGFLTQEGNVYTGTKTSLMVERIALLLGDKNAVQDANRYFQLMGQRDELNLEVLSNRLPSAEEIIAAHRIVGQEGYDKWRKQAKRWLEYFELPGDPVSSDISKVFYPQFYRLKDILKDRPAGPLLTVNDYKRFSQSMLSLGRSEIELEINGKKVDQMRSMLEQWRGYAEKGNMPMEEARDLGEFNWNAVQVPENVKELANEMQEELEGDKVRVVESVDLKKIPEEMKEKIKKLLDETDGVGAEGLYTYYTLMNWLAGRDSKIKAPWLFIIDETENLRDLETMGVWTNKEKFLNIVWHGKAQAWGNWRKLYKKYGTKDAVDKHLNILESKNTQKGKRDWYKGIRNLPVFAKIMAQKITEAVPSKDGTIGDGERTMMTIVEGTKANPGLAAKFGFLSTEELSDPTEHRLKDHELRKR